MSVAIEADGVEVRYGDTVALRDASLRVDAGRICALIGTNGAGKSTLFAALTGTTPLSAGAVRLAGQSSAAARASGTVAFVPQAERVDWSFPVSVLDVVEMGTIRARGIIRRRTSADRAAARGALARVGMDGYATRPIGALSGGQRKRVFLARAIAQDATILLLDEPFAGVDRRSEAEITELLHQLAAEQRTILVSTHDIAGVAALAHEAALIRGTVLFHGPVAEALAPVRLGPALGLPLEEGDAA